MSIICPVEYDHNDDLELCRVCGWGSPVIEAPARGPKDMDTLTGPERIREAIAILSGAYAPTQRVVICGEQS